MNPSWKNMGIAFLFALLALQTVALQNIEELSDQNFAETVLQSQDIWIVAFTAQWCGHCKRLKPQLQSLALEIQKLGVKLAHVDEKQNQKLIGEYVVNHETHMVSYPTLVAFKNGNPINLPGHVRTANTIMEWAVDHFQLSNKDQEYEEDNNQVNTAVQVDDDEVQEL